MQAKNGRGKFEIFVDGGVRRATDVLKAVALGATAVGIGRPMIYAMSTYGEDGVGKLLQILKVCPLRPQSLQSLHVDDKSLFGKCG